MAIPKKSCILLNVSSAVRAKLIKLIVRTCFYRNYELCILSNLARKSERLFSGFKRQTLFLVTPQIDARQCTMKSLQEPYKLCRSKPWHNEITSRGWEYKHLRTASILLLEDSIAQAARSKRNRTFTLPYARCFHSVNFTAEFCITVQIDFRNDKYLVYNVHCCRICYELLEKYQPYSQSCLYRVANIFISKTWDHDFRQTGRWIIDHFTVSCLVAWPMNVSEAGGDLVLIETSLLFSC